MRRALNILLGCLAFVLAAGLAAFFLKPGLDGIGTRLDVNGDDYLTVDELPPIVRRQVEAIDSSGDGRIDPVELRVYMLNQIIRGRTTHEAPAWSGEYTFDNLRRYFAEAVGAGELWGGVIMLGRGGETFFTMSVGNLKPTTQVPMASATKWVSAAVMGALHDDGVIDLDRPIGEWADGIPASHATMTIPQMMGHVSGMDTPFGIISAPSLDDAAARILQVPLKAAPGEQFRYGSASMMLAAWVAEQQAGRPWRELAHDYLFGPLEMVDTTYASPLRPLPYGEDMAPEVASGLHATAEDYMKFLALIAQGGGQGDLKLLRVSTIRKMEQAQSVGAERASVPPAVTHDFEYAMGVWCERWEASGECTLIHSQGAFGTRPFLDRGTGIYGIILMVESGDEQRLIIQRLREVALEVAKHELGFNN